MDSTSFFASPAFLGAAVATVVLVFWLLVLGPDARLRRRLRRFAATVGDSRVPVAALRLAPARVRAAAERALALFEAGNGYDAAAQFDRAAGEAGGAARAELANLAGICHYLAGRPAAAAERYEQCVRVAREAGAVPAQAAGLANLALLQLARNEPELAHASQEQALALDRQAGDKAATAAGLGRLGLIWQARGDITRALDLQLEALALNEAAGNRRGIAEALGRIGLAWQVQGELDRALDYYRRGLGAARRAGYHAGAAELLGNIGLLHLERGEVEPALAGLLGALAIFGARRDTARAVNVVNGLALVRARMGREQFEAGCRRHGIAAGEVARLAGLLDKVAVRPPAG